MTSPGGVQLSILTLLTTLRWLRTHIAQFHAVDDDSTVYMCVCSQVFKQKDDLRRHIADVHSFGDVSTFQCDICFKVFKQKKSLNAHLQKVHG